MRRGQESIKRSVRKKKRYLSEARGVHRGQGKGEDGQKKGGVAHQDLHRVGEESTRATDGILLRTGSTDPIPLISKWSYTPKHREYQEESPPRRGTNKGATKQRKAKWRSYNSG